MAIQTDGGSRRSIPVHSRFVRTTHWLNAIAIIVMIGSGWRIYNNVPIFPWLTSPEWATLGGDPEITYKLNKDVGFSNALLWHFAFMWLFFINGLVALSVGLWSGRLQRKWLPISLRELVHDIRAALSFNLAHDDITVYNAVQKLLYACLGARDLETGTVQLAYLAVLRFPRGAARAFPRHVGHRAVSACACDAVHSRSADDCRDDQGHHPRARTSSHGSGRIAMTLIRPGRSLNRPQGGVDQSALIEHRELIAGIERRAFLRGTASLGALTLLTGCDISNESALQGVLRAMSAWNDRVQAFIFNPRKLAPTYSDADVMMPPRFNAFYSINEVKPVDGASWKLELAGKIENKKPWTKEALYALPRETQITRVVCVEGWDYIGKWSGVPLRGFFDRIGADKTAKYVAFRCADKYWGSIDMATALHPQTILATHYAGQPIGDA